MTTYKYSEKILYYNSKIDEVFIFILQNCIYDDAMLYNVMIRRPFSDKE